MLDDLITYLFVATFLMGIGSVCWGIAMLAFGDKDDQNDTDTGHRP